MGKKKKNERRNDRDRMDDGYPAVSQLVTYVNMYAFTFTILIYYSKY